MSALSQFRTWMLVLPAVLAMALAGCATTATPIPADTAQTSHLNGRGLLWRIDNGTTTPSYVFGTLHVSDSRVLDLPPVVAAAFEGARAAGFETVEGAETEDDIVAMMTYQNGRTLEDAIGSELFQALVQFGNMDEDKAAEFNMLKPWAVAILIEKSQLGNDGPVLDQMLTNRAVDEEKPVFPLESSSEQMIAFDSQPEAHQVARLISTLRDISRPQDVRAAELERAITAYLARDTSVFYRTVVAEPMAEGTDHVEQVFLSELVFARNERFVERMMPWLKRGGAFVAMGALHLPGERGVVNLLQQRGFMVHAVY